ncbi:MAG: hypothetical protein GQ582_01325 [Methyloprofundus sp.]|nr:hypothetical protein [Methyloprofundus sp.]
MRHYFIHFISLGLLCLLVVEPALANSAHKKAPTDKLKEYQQIDWSKYTIAAVKHKVPKKMQGNDITLLPVQSLYFLPEVNQVEMNKTWQAAGHPWPKIIIIANGVYDLASLHRLINNEHIFKKIDAKTFITYRPIYIAPTASLVIDNAELRLSTISGVYIISNGKLYITNSVFTSWDENSQDYGVREHIPEKELLFYGTQFPRPYLMLLNQSEIYAANSKFTGLGYKGQMGSFGISMSNRLPKENSAKIFDDYLRKLKKPTGWFIGNTFEHNYFGFYSNEAENVVILGNIYLNNTIYNIDPHDFSYNLLIARNLSYQAEHAHGIIISREVNNTTIAENISIKNYGTGIMLDRNSEHNLIYNNLTMANKGDGIAIFESDHNLLLDNTATRNGHTGIVVRNSCHIKVQANYLFRNVKSGTEISVLNIDYLETRDFVLDHYHQATSSHLLENIFESNLSVAINSNNKPTIHLQNNRYLNSGSAYFAGDLVALTRDIVTAPKETGFSYQGENPCPK